MSQQDYMEIALELAKKGKRAVDPNPMVGAVIVKNNQIIGQGYHRVFGGPHAEVEAVNSVENKADLKGATIYVTLEPCRHHGKTPPCQKLIESVGIEQVFYGSADPFQTSSPPNSPVKSVQLTGKIADECQKLNKHFFTWVTKKRPFITVKIATSADGFVAHADGSPAHVTTSEQDKTVHQLRANHQAIMVGSNTVLNDNPALTVRHISGPDPLRIILDRQNRVPKTAQVFKDNHFLHLTQPLPIQDQFKYIANQNISSVLVEPGPTLYQVLNEAELIDELIVLKGEVKLGQGLKIEI